MKVTRRGLLGVAAGATGAGLVHRELARADEKKASPARLPQYDEEIVPTVCQQCPGGCGLLARVVDGQLVGLAGNPYHPVNRGAVCAKVFGALQLLHSPERLRGPMVKDGQRGKLRPASWNEALKIVGDRLADLRGKRLAHTVAILGGQYRGTRDAIWRQFARAYGTPNYIRARCLAPEKPALAHQRMHGAKVPFAHDIGEAEIVVSFGAGLLDAWQNPVYASRALARMRRGEKVRGRLIQIDPRRSPTAIKADRWVSLVPGTDGILALGLANVLVREGLYDAAFVEEHTRGFDEFKAMVLRDYGLLAVSSATGVPVNTILEVARDLGTVRPALVIGERGGSFGPDDLRTRMAIHSLNALVGSIGARGGLLPQSELPLSPLPSPAPDQLAALSLAQPRIDGAGEGDYAIATDAPQALPAHALAGTPYPLNALLVFATNPLASQPAKEELARAMEKVPLVVSFSPFLDETAARADVVLPDSLFFERWQDDGVTHLANVTCYSVGRPASKPLFDTRNTADVVLQLAASLGGSVAQALPWKSFDETLKVVARGVFESRRGHVVAGAADEPLRRSMERQGYWMPEFESFEKFFAALAKRGAWSDETALPPGRKAAFANASGKFEFKAPDLPAVAFPGAPLASAFPLRLNTYRLATRPMGGARGQPWLLEQPAAHLRTSWESWIEIHPETAHGLGVKDGDPVVVESPKGQVNFTARLYAGTRPDVVNVPLFSGLGPNPNDLVAGELDRVHGFGLTGTTRVRIRRA